MSQNSFDTPVLFLIFNRPESTFRVFEQIKRYKPSRLFIAADGPRNANEKVKCDEVRSITDRIDWPCDVKTLFREKNLGCGAAVSSAITWFFENAEEGIVLEDDCCPSQSFFKFCSILLEKYRFDERIGHISGFNIQGGIKRGSADYYFSEETQVWGWATWKRVWNKYDLSMNHLKEFEKSDQNPNLRNNKLHSLVALYDFKKVLKNKIDTWDYQYTYTNFINHSLSVIPNENLIENIGFTADATHTKEDNTIFSLNKAKEIDLSSLKHPTIILPHKAADSYSFKKHNKFTKLVYVIIWYFILYKRK